MIATNPIATSRWREPPEKSSGGSRRRRRCGNETLFLNQAMRWGTPEVVLAVRRHFDNERLRQALREALPGIFDRRSWAYWHLVLDMGPPPPMPVREIPGVDPADTPLRVWPEDFRKART